MTPHDEKGKVDESIVESVATNAVLETRVESLRRDIGRLYRWVLALVGSNVSVILTVVLDKWL